MENRNNPTGPRTAGQRPSANPGQTPTENPEVKISVLIPVYNVESYLPRCLDSILGQTFTDLEVVCVNDASPDGSARILEQYAARDPRVRIITKETNQGLMMARKTGYLNARGNYIFFCDSDDFIPAETLADLYRKATGTGADITVGDMYQRNLQGRLVLRNRRNAEGPDGMNYLRAILNGATCSLCGSLYRRELLTGQSYHTLLHQSFSEDRILLTQLLLITSPKVAVSPTPSYYYCLNPSSITRRRLSDEALREQLKALFWCYDYVNAGAPGIAADNRNFIVRYMSLYLEKGAPRSVIESSYPEAYDMLQFSAVSKATSPRFAFHTVMCKHSVPYRTACTGARRLIRKIQGKD